MAYKISLSLIILLTLLLFSNSGFSQEKIAHKFVDKKMIGATIGESYLKDLVPLHGEGSFMEIARASCYFQPKTYQFIVFLLCEDHLLCGGIIHKDEGYAEKCKKPIDIDLVTGKGIRLGDTLEKVLEIYGNPEKSSQPGSDGMQTIEYHTTKDEDSSVALAYDAILKFKNGELIELFIYDGP